MIKAFGVENFFGFKDGVHVSLECPIKSSGSFEDGYTRLMAITGANASGKTNVLKALEFFTYFACESFNLNKPKDIIPFRSFANNDNHTAFHIDLVAGDCDYRYEVTLTDKIVISEKIYRIKKRESLVVERTLNQVVARAEFKELESIKKVRENVSIISLAYQHEIAAIFPLYYALKKVGGNVSILGRYTDSEFTLDLSDYCEKLQKSDDKFFNFVKDVLRESDTGVEDIEIYDSESAEGVNYFPIFYHRNKDDIFDLTFNCQSEGTKKLFKELAIYKASLESGSVLIMDEFDTHLHSDLLPKLMGLYTDGELNPRGAQLIVSTHNSAVLEHLNKYQIFITAKIDNECFGYRLDELDSQLVRGDRSIRALYEANKLGGRPKL